MFICHPTWRGAGAIGRRWGGGAGEVSSFCPGRAPATLKAVGVAPGFAPRRSGVAPCAAVNLEGKNLYAIMLWVSCPPTFSRATGRFPRLRER